MGIEYTLVNYRTKQMIQLGKGCWWDFNSSPENFLYREGIEEILIDHGYFDNTEEMKIYWNEIIDMIWNFVKNENVDDIVVVGDGGDDKYILKCHQYRYVDSRYRSDNLDDLANLNKHLEPKWADRYKREDSIIYFRNTGLNLDKI